MPTELLAQLVELQSVLAADRRMPEPRDVPRPDWWTARGGGASAGDGARRGADAAAGGRNPYAAAIQRMIAVPAPGPRTAA